MNAVDNEVEAAEAVEMVPRQREGAEAEQAEADSIATMALRVDRVAQVEDETVEDDGEVLIATEYFDAGFVGGLDEDTDAADTEDAEDSDEPEEDDLLSVADAVEPAPPGARAAARLARQAAAAEAVKAERIEPGNRRHGVLGLALLLVLGYQLLPAAVPGRHVGVNVVLAALVFGLWAMQRKTPEPRRGGRRRADVEDESTGRRGSVLGGLGLALIAFAAFAPDPTNLGGRFVPLAMLGTVLLLLGVNTEPPGRLAHVMAFPPLRRLGQMCMPLLASLVVLVGVLPATIGFDPNAGTRIALTALAVVVGYLSMRQMERSRAAQIQRARHRSAYVVGATASASAVALAFGAPGGSGSTTTASEFVAAVESTPVAPPVSPAANLPFGERCWAIAPAFDSATCTFGDPTSKTTVALTGDQSAGAWLPALQALGLTKGWKISTFLAADCSLTRSTDPACQTWSLGTAREIVKGRYDLVVVADDSATAEGGSFGEALRKAGQTVIGMPELVGPVAK